MNRYRERILLRGDSSAAGAAEPDYSGVATASKVPARIVSVRGDETFRGRQLEAGIEYVVELRPISSIDVRHRVEVESGAFAGRVLGIQYVNIVPAAAGRPARLELYCKEVR